MKILRNDQQKFYRPLPKQACLYLRSASEVKPPRNHHKPKFG